MLSCSSHSSAQEQDGRGEAMFFILFFLFSMMKPCLNSAGERCNCAGVGCPANRYNSSEYRREHKVSTVEIMRSVCVSFRLLFLVGLIIYPSLGKKNHPPRLLLYSVSIFLFLSRCAQMKASSETDQQLSQIHFEFRTQKLVIDHRLVCVQLV